MRSILPFALAPLLTLSACASETTIKTVYVPVEAPVTPSSA